MSTLNCIAKLNWVTKASAVFLLWGATAMALPAQTFTVLHNFNGTEGGHPYAGLVQATDGNFYGSTEEGGANGEGAVFKINPSGALAMLHSFNGADGSDPRAPLVQAANGDLYGTAEYGGIYGFGTVYKITPNGNLTTLHSFDNTDGAYPYAGLVQGADGNFYGTTSAGGANSLCEEDNCGTVFKVTPNGTLTTLYSFCSQSRCADGELPLAGLVQGTDGNFYGTTYYGGASDAGVVFQIAPGGTLTVLNSFDGTNGGNPSGGLLLGTDGNFYGTTSEEGANDVGTVFKVTAGGALTLLYSFCPQPEKGCPDGGNPNGSLIQATDGDFYGTTEFRGARDDGTIFQINANGKLTTLHSFEGSDGAEPSSALIQDTNGILYGTAFAGGDDGQCGDGCGTVFSLSMGLGPFVKTNPAAGKVGSSVGILGTDLTGATSVKFNGTATAFRVVSSTFIEAKVPSGATTGTVQVQLPSGTLSSNVPFIVLR